jgi:hypothetical protein
MHARSSLPATRQGARSARRPVAPQFAHSAHSTRSAPCPAWPTTPKR